MPDKVRMQCPHCGGICVAAPAFFEQEVQCGACEVVGIFVRPQDPPAPDPAPPMAADGPKAKKEPPALLVALKIPWLLKAPLLVIYGCLAIVLMVFIVVVGAAVSAFYAPYVLPLPDARKKELSDKEKRLGEAASAEDRKFSRSLKEMQLKRIGREYMAYEKVIVSSVRGSPAIMEVTGIFYTYAKSYEVASFTITLYDASGEMLAAGPIVVTNFKTGEPKTIRGIVSVDSRKVDQFSIQFDGGW